MTKGAKYDIDQFRKLVLAGKTKPEIMQEMNIAGYPQFNSLELRLFKTDKKVYEIASGSNKDSTDNVVSVGPKFNITIPKKILKNSSFTKDDKFNLTFRGKKIILTLIEN